MTDAVKLDAGQKHVLKLIDRDRKLDGWTAVSAQLYPHLSKSLPSVLAVFEPVGNDGRGRARLTEQGESVLMAMEWL